MALGALCLGAALASSSAFAERDAATPQLELVWSVEGEPYGSSRSLEPTLTIATDKVFVDANVTKDDRRHEVIRAFGLEDGHPAAMIANPDGDPFEGLGDSIAVNDRFLVTALYGKAQFGKDAELLVYDADTLDLRHRIKNPREGNGAFFGQGGVALHKDRVLAATAFTQDQISTAWLFSAETGEILLTIDEPDVPTNSKGKVRRSFFGHTLAMNETHIAIAANDRSGPGGLSARGVVYIFDARDGSLLHRLDSPGSGRASLFGRSMTMSEDTLYVSGLDDTGELNWPTGTVYAFDLGSGKLKFEIADPGVPKDQDEFSAGKQGWGFPSGLSVDGPYLFSGLPDWSGEKQRQGGLIVLDAQTGEQIFIYRHKTGEGGAAYGTTIAAGHGYVAAMEEKDFFTAKSAKRVHLFKVEVSDSR
ncbi:MAG: hypothetical protein AAF251_15540 [Pseudomonadota bacterium]